MGSAVTITPDIKPDQGVTITPDAPKPPAPNSTGLANRELAKSGLSVGGIRAPKQEMKAASAPVGFMESAIPATLEGLSHMGPQPEFGDKPEDLNAFSRLKSDLGGMYEGIARPAREMGAGNYASGLGEIAGDVAGSESFTVPAARAALPRGLRAVGEGLESHAPTIGKVAGYGTGIGLAAEELYHGRPYGAAVSLLSPKAAKIGESAARGTGRLFQRLGQETPPPVEPARLSLNPARFEAPASTLRPPLALTEGNPRDIIASNPGERGLQMARGQRMSQPVTLPSGNRGLMLPERSASTPRGVPSPEPTRNMVNTIAKEAVRGAGGTPETPAPPAPGKPIFQRPAAPTGPPGLKPEGPSMMTPTVSSALQGYHYDPATQTITIHTKSGGMYRYGEVTPEEFSAFENAGSKGKAYADIRNNHVQTGANYGKGWVNKIPNAATRSSDELVPALEESIRQARAKPKK